MLSHYIMQQVLASWLLFTKVYFISFCFALQSKKGIEIMDAITAKGSHVSVCDANLHIWGLGVCNA